MIALLNMHRHLLVCGVNPIRKLSFVFYVHLWLRSNHSFSGYKLAVLLSGAYFFLKIHFKIGPSYAPVF